MHFTPTHFTVDLGTIYFAHVLNGWSLIFVEFFHEETFKVLDITHTHTDRQMHTHMHAHTKQTAKQWYKYV